MGMIMTAAIASQRTHIRKIFDNIIHGIVLVLSLLLIVYISYDTFMQIPFLSNHEYMTFQFWVCVVFLSAFFVELLLSKNKKEYIKRRWFFLLISIPYLNIINQYNIHFSAPVLYYLRFVPLIRGAYSLSMVLGYISKNRAASLLSQYVTILAAAVYILALIFYYQEYKVNENVNSFWDALYWSAMNMTTVGCYFSAVTPVGKIISVILPILGMLMLPLFTVYVTDLVIRHNSDNPTVLKSLAALSGGSSSSSSGNTQGANPSQSPQQPSQSTEAPVPSQSTAAPEPPEANTTPVPTQDTSTPTQS